jgi:hypothetical protein
MTAQHNMLYKRRLLILRLKFMITPIKLEKKTKFYGFGKKSIILLNRFGIVQVLKLGIIEAA